jgi:tetratricopeptide (TPR) repeat protein
MSRLWPVLLLLISGCSLAVLEPGAEQQREIYQKIATEIDQSLQRGDAHLRQGDFYQALTSYRQAAFYQPSAGLASKIQELETKISKNSAVLFAQGQELLPHDELAALKVFNQAVRLNPDHRQAREIRDRLLRVPETQATLADRQSTLQRAWKDYPHGEEPVTSLLEQAEAILALQHENPLALEVSRHLDRERREDVRHYLTMARELFAAGQFQESRLSARQAQVIEPGNREALVLLSEIQQQQDYAYLLNLTRFRLEKNDYEKAEESAGMALGLEVEPGEAAALLDRARLARLNHALEQVLLSFAQGAYEEAVSHLQWIMTDAPLYEQLPDLRKIVQETLAQKIPLLLAEGRKLFNENRLNDANRILTCVLDLDPDNQTAATYLKKVRNRLQTIQSLQ